MSIPLIVIPARVGAARLPNKPLLDLCGRPLVVRVWERLAGLEGVDLMVATDDIRVVRAVEEAGGVAMMTRASHRSGTERVAEVAEVVALGVHEIIINVQGDEPFVAPRAIRRLIRWLQDHPSVPMATLACPLRALERWKSRSVVKVVVDGRDRALYFSRAPIPGGGGEVPPSALQHIGVYGFRREALGRVAAAPPCPLELAEDLEQLRALWLGLEMGVIRVEGDWQGVDTAEDLACARAHFK